MSAIPSGLGAINTLLQYGNGASPEVWTTVVNVGDISGFDLKMAHVKTTSHSTGNPWDTKVPTVGDAGQLSFPVFYIPQSSSHAFLLNEIANRIIRPWRMVWALSGGVAWQCDGFIVGVKGEAKVADVEKAMLTIELTGDPVLPTTGTI